MLQKIEIVIGGTAVFLGKDSCISSSSGSVPIFPKLDTQESPSPFELYPSVFDQGATLRKPASFDDLEEDEKFSSQVIWLKYFLFDVLPY